MPELTLEVAVKDMLDSIQDEYGSLSFASPIPEKIRIVRELLDKAKKQDLRPIDIECPKCSAAPGYPCTSSSDGEAMIYFHVVREADAIGSFLDMACKWCGCPRSKHYGPGGCCTVNKSNGKWTTNCKCAVFGES